MAGVAHAQAVQYSPLHDKSRLPHQVEPRRLGGTVETAPLIDKQQRVACSVGPNGEASQTGRRAPRAPHDKRGGRIASARRQQSARTYPDRPTHPRRRVFSGTRQIFP